jgi:hypothetical protein
MFLYFKMISNELQKERGDDVRQHAAPGGDAIAKKITRGKRTTSTVWQGEDAIIR